MTQIVVFQEKYGNRYFDASTPESRGAAFLKMLRERFTSGYYYYEPKAPTRNLSKEDKAILDLSDQQLDALPAALKEATKTKIARLQRSLRGAQQQYEQDKPWWDSVVALLALPVEEAKQQNEERYIRVFDKRYVLASAESLMEARNDYEYEMYYFDALESTD